LSKSLALERLLIEAGSASNRPGEADMCPVCVSTAALLTASVTSTGGIAALVISKLRSSKRTNSESDPDKNEERENG
jgi:hypothetical protein